MAPPTSHPRYNAKARGSVAGGSHKKRKRPSTKLDPSEHEDGQDPTHPTGDLEDSEPREKMSSKKRKRLDSYIAKKLKSEQRLKTLNLLASLAPSTSTSANLVSTSSLGQNPFQGTTAAEKAELLEDRAVRRGIESIRRRNGGAGSGEDDQSGSSGDERKGKVNGKGKEKEGEVFVVQEESEEEVPTTVIPNRLAKGTGKQPGKQPRKQANWNPNLLPTQPQSDSSDFDSSDSAYDTPDDTAPGPSSSAKPAKRMSTSPEKAESPRLSQPHFEPVPERKPSPPVLSSGPGGALKKSADGKIAVRVEQRRVKMPRGRTSSQENSEDDDDDGETEGEGSGSSDNDSDEESGSERSDPSLDDEEEEREVFDDGDNAEASEDSRIDDTGSADSAEDEVDKPVRKPALGFKDWALRQMGRPTTNDTSLISPTTHPTSPPTIKKEKVAPKPRRGPAIGPLGGKFEIPTSSLLSNTSKPSTARPKINRRSSVSESRMDLPILAEEQAIVEAILLHPVVIIAGETGSGKTTQVPQMLYEAGSGFNGSDNPGMIAVTQPRRVAAVSLSARVKSELNLPHNSSVVAHQIRYSSTTSQQTSIKFMTDGVLLRELATDFLLSRYSVVIVDEAHERGVNTDVLIGVLSRVSKLREKMWREKKDTKPLRIVIMSATLRVEDFAENTALFKTPPPIIHIAARQHPVTVHFARRTVSDYVTEAYKKVCKIHARLPVGGILVFMTGQNEIMTLCRKLENKYGKEKSNGRGKPVPKKVREEAVLPPEEPEAEEVDLGNQDDLAVDVDDGAADSDPEALDSDDDGVPDFDIGAITDTPMHILPLYSLLANDQQMQVFKPPPLNHRLVIIATNVAETSLTIPGIRYVVDSGRAKERQYDPTNGVQTFAVSWISKASASQRTGRAGRTGPGHCYRLYSSALYEDHFEAFSKPEILRMPIEGVVLQMKSMNIDQVVNFPFPTPPDRYALKKAEDLLTFLGALELATSTRMISGTQQAGTVGGRITDLGKAMAGYPVSPRFAKMLVIGSQHGCLPYVVAIVAGLSVGDPFVHEQSIETIFDEDEDEVEAGGRKTQIAQMRSEEVRAKEETKEVRRKYFKAHSQFMSLGNGTSDMFKLLAAVGAYEYDPTSQFCQNNFLRAKAMQEIQQLRGQISKIAKLDMKRLSPPTDTQLKVIRQILTAGFIDQIAVRSDIFLKSNKCYTSSRNVAYRATGLGSEEVFIHPSSALFHKPPPEFLTFQEITRTDKGKVWMKGVTKINPGWLSTLGKGMCSFSKPVEAIMKGRGKREDVREGEREVVVVPHFRDLGVDLPGVRRKQRREGTRWVLVE